MQPSPQNRSLPSSMPPAGGKEELRASLLRPYLLRIAEQFGENTLKTLLLQAGLPSTLMHDETAWLSVAVTRRALEALGEYLDEDSLAHRGDWATRPEVLAAYVRLLRSASTPLRAYRYLAEHAAESTRVGHYELLDPHRTHATLVYRPHPDVDELQRHKLLCRVRAAELGSIPRLWGLGDAQVSHASCLAEGDDACTYVLRWSNPSSPSIWLTSASSGAICGAIVTAASSLYTGAIAFATTAALGAALGMTWRRLVRERATRVFERNRIAALEHGLELRGHNAAPAGDIAGSVLGGRYRILHKIGSGGIGAVYAAEHVGLGSRVAIKLLRGAAAADAAETARLRREAHVQVSIEHPNVVRTLDLDQLADGSIYVVMELLDGYSLADKIRDEGLVAPGFALPVFLQVCHALEAAHRIGVVHRDLKPGNVFILRDGGVKVLDFGMSKFAEAESLTQDGYTLGTPEYMAPEQCIGAHVEPRTDIYAFGVLMYEALTGHYPIGAQNRQDLLDLHQRMIPEAMLARRPELPIPALLDRTVMRCLAKRPHMRPDAAELGKLLASIPLDLLPTSYPRSESSFPGHQQPTSRYI